MKKKICCQILSICIRAPFRKVLQLMFRLLNNPFAIELRLISVMQLFITPYETGPREGDFSIIKIVPNLMIF